MSRDRMFGERDHIVTSQAKDEPLFRIFAVEPHGWSTVLIEDQQEHIFLCSTTAAALTEVSASDAKVLLANRSYRRWYGTNEWATLSQLPLVAATFSRPASDISQGSEGATL